MFTIFFQCEDKRMSAGRLDMWFATQDNCFRFNQKGVKKLTIDLHLYSHNVINASYFDIQVIPSNSVFPEPRLKIIGDFTI
jgi:hypothetical protein